MIIKACKWVNLKVESLIYITKEQLRCLCILNVFFHLNKTPSIWFHVRGRWGQIWYALRYCCVMLVWVCFGLICCDIKEDCVWNETVNAGKRLRVVCVKCASCSIYNAGIEVCVSRYFSTPVSSVSWAFLSGNWSHILLLSAWKIPCCILEEEREQWGGEGERWEMWWRECSRRSVRRTGRV